MKGFPYIEFFHKETQKKIEIPTDEKKWPVEWKTVEYKEYPRFHRYELPSPEEKRGSDFFNVLGDRTSRRSFSPPEKITLQDFSNLLYWSSGKKEKDGTRFYPSGGMRFPLEVYFAFKGNAELPRGVYHYNVKLQALEYIFDGEIEASLRALPNYSFAKNAPIYFIISGIFDRQMRKYKERGYRFVLIETGALLQNVYLVGEAFGFSICAVGVSQDEEVESILDFHEDEKVIITCAAGKKV